MRSSLRADWILPIAGPPIPGGSVTVEDGRVASVQSGTPAGARDLGRCVVLPALVNAHTHLELSYLRGRIPSAASFTEWVRPLLAARRMPPDRADASAAAADAIAEAVTSGTGLFGDVANAMGALDALRALRTPAHVFYELLGFAAPDPDARVAEARARIEAEQRAATTDGHDLRFSVAPHAPYSVSPALFDAIRRDSTSHDARTTVHLGEGREEVQLLADGTGPWRGLLETLGVWTETWQPPACSPVAYLHRRGFLDASTLVVHGVQFTAADIALVRDAGATIVSCPRSNAYVGAGAPPLANFYAAGVPVAFGTDSLASVGDLNLFNELAAARRIAPSVPAASLLQSGTRVGAQALGFDRDYGTIEPGKRAALITVQLPADVRDVEEYLVSGVPAAAVAWVPSA